MVSPWHDLEPVVTRGLRAHLPLVAAEITSAVAAEVPAYTQPIAGALGERLRAGVMRGLGHFLDLAGRPDPPLGPLDQQFYRTLGRGELREHRDLQTLLAAYRVGTRVAFRCFAEVLVSHDDVPPQILIALAEALFAYMDEVSATSAQGYADEQALRAGEHERLRHELLDLLLSAAADSPALAAAAAAAHWPLPATVVAVMTAPTPARHRPVQLGRQALLGQYKSATIGIAVVAAPVNAVEQAQFVRQVTGQGAVISPARPPTRLHTVLNMTSLAYALRTEQVLTADPLLVEEHLAMLILHADRPLTDELLDRCLAPLLQVKEASRPRLALTLLSWLEHRGERQRIAADLHIHPQTVGYRLTQLRSLFGAALDSPLARFELEMALRVSTNDRPDRPPTDTKQAALRKIIASRT